MKINRNLQFLFALIFIGLAVFFVFSPSGGFLSWDDNENVVHNENIHQFNGATIEWAFTHPHLGVWEPLSFILKASIIHFFGINPYPFKLISLILHFLNIILLMILMNLILQATGFNITKDFELGIFITSLFFALSPLRVSCISWVSCQPYLLCALFSQLSIIFYLKYSITNNRRFHPYLLLSLVFFIFAGMSKAVAMTLPVILILIDIYPLKRFSIQPLKNILSKLPFFLVSIFIAGSAIWARSAFTYFESVSRYNILHRLMISSYGFVFYLRKALFPFNFSPFYPLYGSIYLPKAEPSIFYSLPFILSLVLIVLFIGVLIYRRRLDGIVIAFFAYGVILSPNIGITISGVNLVADRYAYIAMLPIYILSAGALIMILRSITSAKRKLLFIIILIFVIAINARNSMEVKKYWNDDRAFWERILEKYHKNPYSYYYLGSEYASDGYTNKNKKSILLAEQFFHKAKELGIHEEKIDYKLAFVQSELKRYKASEKSFERYLRKEPLDAIAIIRYADILVEMDKIEKAILIYKKAKIIDKDLAGIHNVDHKIKILEDELSKNPGRKNLP